MSTALPPTEVASQLKLRTLYPVYFRKSIPFSSIRFNQIPFSVPERTPPMWGVIGGPSPKLQLIRRLLCLSPLRSWRGSPASHEH